MVGAAPVNVNVTCPQCSGITEPSAPYCPHCAAEVPSPECPSCHAPLAPNAKFCSECGKPVAPAQPVGATTAP